MSKHLESNEFAEQELRSAYLCGCRLLQWMAERLPVDRRSCMMRGMEQVEWYSACSLLVGAGVIDSRLFLRVSLPKALKTLRQHFEELLATIHASELRSGSTSRNEFVETCTYTSRSSRTVSNRTFALRPSSLCP